LLEVGTGFHPELTGRENIFLNGAILGMTKAEIKSKLDEIVAFAEVNRYLDTPVKRYSSGMYVRLAFAVAAHLEPEILIVDEVLAVGDAEFQKKCLGKMKDVAGKGRTVLFVSHNMDAVRNLCQRGIWLKDGRLHRDGSAEEVTDAYFDGTASAFDFTCANEDYGLVIQKLTLKNSRGEETSQFRPGEDLIVEIHYEARMQLEKPYLTLGVIGAFGPCFTANMLLDGIRPETMEGTGTIACRFKSIPLLPQGYDVKMGIRAKNGVDVIVDYREVASFRVAADLAEYGYKGEFMERASRYTPVVIPYEWHFPDGTAAPVSLNRTAS
jgi:lipopolysaccharide transport system ATP-binding protein